MSEHTVTCVYCGHAYPRNTPSYGDVELTAHIRVCEKHPMRKAEADRDLLRKALVGLIDADGDELAGLEANVRLLPAPDADKVAMLNGIHALRATLPPKA